MWPTVLVALAIAYGIKWTGMWMMDGSARGAIEMIDFVAMFVASVFVIGSAYFAHRSRG